MLNNKSVGPASQFDVDRVAADPEACQLPPEFEAVDIVAIQARL